MRKISVKLPDTPYAAIVQSGLLRDLVNHLAPFLESVTQVIIVSSPTVWGLWGGALQEGLGSISWQVILMPEGESAKNLRSLERMAEEMVATGADRNCLVLAFGGGVVGDVGSFLASIYMRGVPVVQVPTTLLAQVDAAIGGKTGVNLRAGKNLLGTFHQPKAVLIDPEVLGTLSEREFQAGLYEVLKCGVIRNAKLFEFMQANQHAIQKREMRALEFIIAESVKVKAEVVAKDERESGLRRILNFGHTVGHALEAETNYELLLHGEAVGLGMNAATFIAEQRGMLPKREAKRILSSVARLGPLPAVKVNPERILYRLGSDKKTVGGVPHFVLPTEIGRVKVVNDVAPEMIVNAIQSICAGVGIGA